MSTIALPVLLLALLLGGCLDPCDNTEVSSAPSPDGRLRAVLYERRCGATTDFTSQVSILGRREKPKSAGNALAADADHGRAPTGSWGGPRAEVRWLANDRLLVPYAAGAGTYRREPRAAAVNIRYERSPRAPQALRLVRPPALASDPPGKPSSGS